MARLIVYLNRTIVWLTLTLMLSVFPIISQARTLEVIGGGLTYHLWGYSYPDYVGKLIDDGSLIANPLVGVGYTNEDASSYASYKVFFGDNSLGYPIGGFTTGHGVRLGRWHLGLVIGGYLQDDDEYFNRGIVPFSLTTGRAAFVLIGGVEANYDIPLNDKCFLRINNLITPALTNHTLSFGFSF